MYFCTKHCICSSTAQGTKRLLFAIYFYMYNLKQDFTSDYYCKWDDSDELGDPVIFNFLIQIVIYQLIIWSSQEWYSHDSHTHEYRIGQLQFLFEVEVPQSLSAHWWSLKQNTYISIMLTSIWCQTGTLIHICCLFSKFLNSCRGSGQIQGDLTSFAWCHKKSKMR